MLLALGGVLGLTALLVAGPLRALLLTALSGLPPLLAVRRQWCALELLAAPGPASLLMLALAGCVLGPQSALVGFVPMLLSFALAAYAWRTQRTFTLRLGWPDAVALLTAVIWVWPVALVFCHNGAQSEGYLARGWLGRDSFYLFALAQEAVERNGWPATNPFLAGVPNYYPSLIHVGLGTLSVQSGAAAPIGLMQPILMLLLLSPVLLVLWVMRASGRGDPITGLITMVAVAGVILLRPDLFVYPQSQPMAMGWLFLLLWLWGESPTPAERVFALALAAAVVLAHSVTGAVAVVVIFGLCVADVGSKATRRVGLLNALLVLVLAVLLRSVNQLPYPPPHGPLSRGSLSEIGAFLAPWHVPLLAGFGMLLGSAAKPLRALGPLAAVGLGGLYYVYGCTLPGGERGFVHFNAERFLHLGLLAALPLAAGGIRTVGLLSATVLLGSALLNPTALAANTRGLVDAQPLKLDAVDLAWFERIRRDTPHNARFLTNLGNYALPAFTGRSQNPIEGNLWGNSTLRRGAFNARFTDATAFFTSPAVGKLAVLKRWRYSHVLLRLDPSEGTRDSWVQQLNDGGFHVLAEDTRYLLLARTNTKVVAGVSPRP